MILTDYALKLHGHWCGHDWPNPIVSMSNQLHVVDFRFSYTDSRYIPWNIPIEPSIIGWARAQLVGVYSWLVGIRAYQADPVVNIHCPGPIFQLISAIEAFMRFLMMKLKPASFTSVEIQISHFMNDLKKHFVKILAHFHCFKY